LEARDLTQRFPKLELWMRSEDRPTLKQLEKFAHATHASVGYFFLETPPVEDVPIPDYRTIADKRLARPSPGLLDTIYRCQLRQHWYREFSRVSGDVPREFVGSLRPSSDIVDAASQIRRNLDFDVSARARIPTWTEALRRFIGQADAAGILVMCSGVVRNDNHRRLDPDEFRGFAIADDRAPLVFINGADTKAAQMFTLAHELAHIWVGHSAISNAQASSIEEPDSLARLKPDSDGSLVERWCNRVAAELLVPEEEFRALYRPAADLESEKDRLARQFKVSTLVVLRRMHETGGLSRSRFWSAYKTELERLAALPKGSGGDFYLTTAARASKRFARAIVVSTLEGQTTFTEAFRLLGVQRLASFEQLGASLGVDA
jgi:Zn-dependent peptidase ImmA (M78 family)